MANGQPPKKSKKVGKKSAAKRGVVDSITPRKASPSTNRLRLQQDIRYYEEQDQPFDYNRHTKGTKKHPRGLPLRSLKPVYKRTHDREELVGYRSEDNDIQISEREYQQLSYNRYAVPTYTPIHGTVKKGKNAGKRTIIAYRNSITGHTVSPYYRNQIFGKEFRKVDTPEQLERANAYIESLSQIKYNRNRRLADLMNSYSLVHPEYVDKNGHVMHSAIAKDSEFTFLIDRLEQLHASAYVNQQVVEEADIALGGTYDPDIVAEELEILKIDIGENEEYQQVLVALGRRLPGESNAVGTSDPHHIKMTVRPYYEAKSNQKVFEE